MLDLPNLLTTVLAAVALGEGKGRAAGWPSVVPSPGEPGSWTSAGNHRFVITPSSQLQGGNVTVVVEWRRSDASPLEKAVFITDGGNTTVGDCRMISATADVATFEFTPTSTGGPYYAYYMPFATCEYRGGSCRSAARVNYLKPGVNGSCSVPIAVRTTGPLGAWSRNLTAQPSQRPVDVPFDVATATAVYQPRAAFESFEPMGMPMTAVEYAAFIARRPAATAAIVVAEVREHPVRMRSRLPARWLSANLSHPAILGAVQPGENFTFQLAVHAVADTAGVTGVSFTPLVQAAGAAVLPARQLRVMNMGGLDFWSRPFSVPVVTVAAGEVRSLWVAAVVPATTASGSYRGTATVTFRVGPAVTVAVELAVAGAPLPNGGDDDPARGSRLHWFDSTAGNRGDTVPAPFTPIQTSKTASGGLLVSALGKRVTIGRSGLPLRISVRRTNQSQWAEVLEPAGVTLDLDTDVFVGPATIRWGAPTNMSVAWQSVMESSLARLTIDGSLDCTGYLSFNATLTAKAGPGRTVVPRAVGGTAAEGLAAGVNLTVPVSGAHLAMGLGRPGGFIERFIRNTPASDALCSWVILDFGSPITLDGIRLCSYGDGVHDPRHMYLQAGTAVSGGGFAWDPKEVRALVGAFSNGTEAAPKPQTQQFAFAKATSRHWRWVVQDCWPSPLTKASHAMVAEVEFHRAGDHAGVFLLNSGTAASSLIASSSGDGTPKNPAWQAVDGIVRYKSFAYGYDAVLGQLPDPPPAAPAANGSNATLWRWDGVNGNNAVWLGSTKAGIRTFLKGDDPFWQAAVPYDSRASPEPPASWSNNGTGGAEVRRDGTVTAFSGPRWLLPGASVSYAWTLVVTPVRPLDLQAHFRDRWAQLGGPGGDYTEFANASVTVVNMHQGNEVNPWINYPYLTNPAMKHAADTCHALGMKFSVYNTMRELSDRCTELFAMVSLNETFVSGAGGGADWLVEHLRDGYLAAWSSPISAPLDTSAVPDPDPAEGTRLQDAGIRVRALSRWNNYYVAGIEQMKRDFGADGVYLDEIAYDRVTMLRVRNVLGDAGRIDHHSNCGGFTPSPATNYMELYPFINRLWYGEGFDYDTPQADYWLAEISGLPSGLSADMLRYTTMHHEHGETRYHYRGMLVGSAFRYTNAASPFSPAALWRFWDAFAIERAAMIGWWEDREEGPGTVPVALSDPNFVATVYLHHGQQALVAIADFGPAKGNYTSALRLSLNWTALGLDRATAVLSVPVIPPFQTDPALVGTWPVGHEFSITDTQGGLLVVVKPRGSPSSAAPSAPAGNCTAATAFEDCTGSACSASGSCVCDPGFSGGDCAALALGKASRAFQADGTWLWGTAPIQDPETKLYHGFTMAIHDSCGINHYRHNGYIVHGTSAHPTGPFALQGTALDARSAEEVFDNVETEDPNVVALPDGSGYLLYYTGAGMPLNRTKRSPYRLNCTKHDQLPDPESNNISSVLADAQRIGVAFSPTLNPPNWTRMSAPILSTRPGKWDSLRVSNPAAHIFTNGTVLLAYRGNGVVNGKSLGGIGMARAPHWAGPYEQILEGPLFHGCKELDIVDYPGENKKIRIPHL